MRPLILTPLALLALGGCAAADVAGLPSLAKRPIEDRFAVVDRPPLAPPGPLPADLTDRLARWRTQAAAADAAFAVAVPATEQLVAAAAGTAPGAENWIAAHQALSRLTSARGPASDALADVDALLIARQTDEAYDGLSEIAALHDALDAMIAAQDRRLEALAAALAP